MNGSENPIARKNGMVIQEMPEEVLVYDLDTNKAHCLNQTAAFIWKSCDGNNSVSDIADLFENESGNKINEDLIWLAIDQLSDKDLLEVEYTTKFKGQSRREVIKKIGLATVVALPLVASLTAPTSVFASSSCMCQNDSDCTPPLMTAPPGCPDNSCGGPGNCI